MSEPGRYVALAVMVLVLTGCSVESHPSGVDPAKPPPNCERGHLIETHHSGGPSDFTYSCDEFYPPTAKAGGERG